ncbi:integrase [Orientia tsutsugamushi]|uniref:Integrase n=1 Tax=Orientia tsutsugamushi TaxID=784 RepID=A0A2R8F0W0_ORITS|nr:hypothetical protein [Orientia tsutsugamushi]SPM44813.1 integrase [Orientia tsutsugamushi]SPM45470.1 integrase [Orientia tsutsugamushi]
MRQWKYCKQKLTSKSKWVLQSDSSKSGHLEQPYEAWNRICKNAGIKNFRIHDLRRTFASCMGMQAQVRGQLV